MARNADEERGAFRCKKALADLRGERAEVALFDDSLIAHRGGRSLIAPPRTA